MRVLMISTDSKILEEGSAVRARMVEYGTICEELHIITVKHEARNTKYETKIKISENVFAYPAVASNKIFALWKAICIGISPFPISYNLKTKSLVVTAQDPFETGLAAWYISRRIGAKLELQIHTDFLSPYFGRESFINKIRVFIAKLILPRADGIRVVSRRISDSLKTENSKLKTVPVVLPIFVDIEKIKNSVVNSDLHKKYPQFDFIVLMASRLTKEKNIGLAIEAMKEVASKYPKTGLIIVGSGSEEKNLKLKTENLKLSDSIVFEPWSDNPISYMKTADCFLLTSNYEGFGLSLVEASASGCPIITTDVGIVGGVLRDKEEVLVCSVGDISSVSKNLLLFIINAELRKDLASRAQKAVECFNITKSEYLNRMREAWEKTSNK